MMVMAFDCLSLKHIHSLSQQKQLFEHLRILVILNPGLRRLETDVTGMFNQC